MHSFSYIFSIFLFIQIYMLCLEWWRENNEENKDLKFEMRKVNKKKFEFLFSFQPMKKIYIIIFTFLSSWCCLPSSKFQINIQIMLYIYIYIYIYIKATWVPRVTETFPKPKTENKKSSEIKQLININQYIC